MGPADWGGEKKLTPRKGEKEGNALTGQAEMGQTPKAGLKRKKNSWCSGGDGKAHKKKFGCGK